MTGTASQIKKQNVIFHASHCVLVLYIVFGTMVRGRWLRSWGSSPPIRTTQFE